MIRNTPNYTKLKLKRIYENLISDKLPKPAAKLLGFPLGYCRGDLDKLLGIQPFLHFVIKTNNYCNLHCEHCTNNCDIPLNHSNDNIFRREKQEIEIEDLILFCERFKGIGESEYHCLTGAEITMMPTSKVEEIIKILSNYGRIIEMATVGFNLMGLSQSHLSKISQITFCDHGINHDYIENCKNYLQSFYTGKVTTILQPYHWDLTAAINHPINKGKRCNLWLRDLSFTNSIIYPCCNLPFIMLRNNNTRIKEELFKAGWTIHNPKLINTLRNWKKTLPKYVIDQCENNCWRPNMDVGQGKTTITLKRSDVISKPIRKEFA